MAEKQLEEEEEKENVYPREFKKDNENKIENKEKN